MKRNNKIEITDNYNKYVSQFFGCYTISKEQGDDLQVVAGKSLAEIKEENPSLLVFPEDLNYHEDGLDNKDKTICSVYPLFGGKSGYILETGNVMGWLGCGNTELKIFSRFDSDLYDEKKETDNLNAPKKGIKSKSDFFLYYILSKLGVFHLTALDFSKGNESILNNLLILMFPALLKNAVSQGLYKEYKTFERNDANVRGVINVNRHIRHNIPFTGKVAYHTREYSFDNDITQLIRHTIEYMSESSIGSAMLENDPEVKQCVDVIYQATPSYNIKERGSIINRNLRPKMHPFYTDYISLQKLCLQILHEEGISYGVDNDDKVHGILFDGAWLWEAYIYSLLSETDLGFAHPDNITKTDAFKMFKTRDESNIEIDEDKRDAYPDFYNKECVLDAKYKHLEKKVQRNDMYQVVSYMHTMPRKKGGYIYPYQTNGMDVKIKEFELNGNGGTIYTFPFLIPEYKVKKDKDNTEWSNFCNRMKEAEKSFKDKLYETNRSSSNHSELSGDGILSESELVENAVLIEL